MTTRRAVHSRMARQDGVITVAQAQSAGMSTSAIHRRLRSGEWKRVETGVFIGADRTYTPAVGLRATVYAAGSGAVAYGPSAAWWHGMLDRPPKQHWVTVPAHRRVKRGTDVRLRTRDLSDEDTQTVRDLAVTRTPLTVLETAVAIPRGSAFMDRALQRHTRLRYLEAAHARNSGRAGAAECARLLRVAATGGESEAERKLQQLLRKAGISGWRAQFSSCGFDIDVVFVPDRLAIEVDGWAFHRDEARFRSDMDRQNELVNAGWRVLRFSWHHVVYEPERVLADIRAALSRQ